MDYDTYGSSAIELAIELANVERTDPEWARAFLTAHADWFTPGTSFELHAHGGHVGFVEGSVRRPRYYLERRIPQWLLEQA